MTQKLQMLMATMRIKFFVLLFLVLSFVPAIALACDPCSLYNVSRLQGLVPHTFTLSVSEQNTSFDRPIDTPVGSSRNGEFVREFSTTQFSASYDFDQQLGFQVTLPVITRVYDQFKEYRYDTKSEVGLGDMTLLGRYSPLNYREDQWSIVGGFSYGIKLPTGDTGTLGEVSGEVGGFKHHAIPSSSGGRALTLGSGSIDYIVGANLFTRFERFLILTDIQYAIRTEGDFDYQFGNDLIISAGPGYYLLLDHQQSLAARLAATGEFKPSDTLRSAPVSGSRISNIYLGPEVLFSLNDSISGQAAVDMRVTGEDPGSTVVPEWRLRAALAYRFN